MFFAPSFTHEYFKLGATTVAAFYEVRPNVPSGFFGPNASYVNAMHAWPGAFASIFGHQWMSLLAAAIVSPLVLLALVAYFVGRPALFSAHPGSARAFMNGLTSLRP